MPEEDIYAIRTTFTQISSSQTYIISQAKSHNEARKFHIARTKALCDNADLSYNKDNKLKHLFPIHINTGPRCPEKKSAHYTILTAYPVPSHPVSYYVYELRKIVI
jgi:hypothetical protein